MLNLYPHHIFFDKVINQITHRKNKLWRFLPASRISIAGMGSIPLKEQFRKQVMHLIGDVEGVIEQISPSEHSIIIETANQTLAHDFEYLGSGKVRMPKIQWHADFKTGNSWQKGVYYLKQRRSTVKGSDIKVPWELSRGHHLLWLGEAFLITHDEKYAREVVDEIEDWWKENPFMYSVNWTCTMDVAIRAVNWLYAVGMVMDSSAVTEEFVKTFYQSLFQHAWFIYNNLEQTIPFSNNHLFSDLTGLVFLSLLFINTKRGKKWYKYSVAALYKEIRCQILPSGVHYERSVSYHRLMTEMVLASLYVLKRDKISLPADIEYRASSMLSYISSYTKANHLSPLVEDNDDGRFLPFVRRDFRQHDYLLDSSSAENLIVAVDVEPIPFEQVRTSRIYKDAGHAVLRKEDVYLFVTNGEQSGYEGDGQTVGTHTHNDKLSFELSLGDNDVIVDPGAYVYTPNPEMSNEFRSTIKHNTVFVDDEEQNIITPKNVFLATKNSRSTKFYLPSATCLEGEYGTFKGRLKHYRRFDLGDNTVNILDSLQKEGANHSMVLSLHLMPQLILQSAGNVVTVESNDYVVDIIFDKRMDVSIVEDTISPSYGVLNNAKTIRAKMSFNEKLDLNTKIQWRKKP